MSKVCLYQVTRGDDSEYSDYLYEEKEYQEAKDEAASIGGKVVCLEYEYSDSYVVDDFSGSEDEDKEEAEEEPAAETDN